MIDKGFGRLGAIFKHHAHGGVTINIGIFSFHVIVKGFCKGYLLKRLHEGIFLLALSGTF